VYPLLPSFWMRLVPERDDDRDQRWPGRIETRRRIERHVILGRDATRITPQRDSADTAGKKRLFQIVRNLEGDDFGHCVV